MTDPTKPLASISLDLDNQWSYMKTHGDQGWESFPSYLDVLVPRVLETLQRHELKITFFIVGQDAALQVNRDALSQLADAGHEVGNHSFHHEPWLHLYSEDQIEEEIASAEDAIESATGIKPRGFRGPGFSVSRSVLDTLQRRGYLYDASTFPTFLGPLARAYYFFKSDLSPEERKKRGILFGGISDGFRRLDPYCWQLSEGRLLEIPVTTMPVSRLPFHVSYLLFLAGYSKSLANFYLSTALQMCRMTGVQPSLLLHPLDFLGSDDISALDFFPGMKLTGQDKLALLNHVFSVFKRHWNVVPMGVHAEHILKRGKLSTVEPRFRAAAPSGQAGADSGAVDRQQA